MLPNPDPTPRPATYWQVQSWPEQVPMSDHAREDEAKTIAAEYRAAYQRQFRVVEKTLQPTPASNSNIHAQ